MNDGASGQDGYSNVQIHRENVEARNSRNLFRDEHWQPHCVSTVAAAAMMSPLAGSVGAGFLIRRIS